MAHISIVAFHKDVRNLAGGPRSLPRPALLTLAFHCIPNIWLHLQGSKLWQLILHVGTRTVRPNAQKDVRATGLWLRSEVARHHCPTNPSSGLSTVSQDSCLIRVNPQRSGSGPRTLPGHHLEASSFISDPRLGAMASSGQHRYPGKGFRNV